MCVVVQGNKSCFYVNSMFLGLHQASTLQSPYGDGFCVVSNSISILLVGRCGGGGGKHCMSGTGLVWNCKYKLELFV